MNVILRRIKKPKTIIEFDGDTIFPYYLDCLGIKWTPEGLEFLLLADHTTTEKTYGKKQTLFLFGTFGVNENTINRSEELMEDLVQKYYSFQEE